MAPPLGFLFSAFPGESTAPSPRVGHQHCSGLPILVPPGKHLQGHSLGCCFTSPKFPLRCLYQLPIPNRFDGKAALIFCSHLDQAGKAEREGDWGFLYTNSIVLRNAMKCYISESRVMARAFMLLKAILPKPHSNYLCQKLPAHCPPSLNAKLSLSIIKSSERGVPW